MVCKTCVHLLAYSTFRCLRLHLEVDVTRSMVSFLFISQVRWFYLINSMPFTVPEFIDKTVLQRAQIILGPYFGKILHVSYAKLPVCTISKENLSLSWVFCLAICVSFELTSGIIFRAQRTKIR